MNETFSECLLADYRSPIMELKKTGEKFCRAGRSLVNEHHHW